ncbi:MAG: virulence RhuM family protein [Treponema sp.]|nr:virulence RhuM family protein [Treponema sp.]
MSKSKNKNNIIIFKTDDEKITVEVRFHEETVWLTLDQMAALFERDKSTVSRHIKNIFDEKELERSSVVANFATTASDGKTYQVDYFNLDVIISVGYRVKSLRGTQFRQWATKRLHEYIQKGFTLDDERLMQGGNRYFRELLQRIRDIRSSERNLWQQVTDIYATSIDYDPKSDLTQEFFATVQNKMHYAVHQQTAAEVIYNRSDSEKPMIGMTNFKGNYITKDDVKIAKNYLSEIELQKLNLLTEGFLGYAELQAIEKNAMTMKEWKDFLDRQLKMLNRDILTGRGRISHKEAIEKAEKEYEIYREKEMKQIESDFDKAVKELTKLNPAQKEDESNA